MKYYMLTAEQIAEKRNISVEGAMQMLPIAPRVKNTGVLGDCGADLFSPIAFVATASDYVVIDTFVGFKLEPGTGAFVWPRGGDAHLVGAGVIDTGYSGTIKVKVVNPYNYDMEFSRGDSLGQLVPFVKAYADGIDLEQVDHSWEIGGRGDTGRINSEV